MTASAPKHLIAHFSLSGTTARVAGWIAARLRESGHQAELMDLAYPKQATGGLSPAEADCLWVLSPVYSMHPAPAVLDFLQGLPAGEGRPAVALATYGVVCSGVALPDMGRLLLERGYRLAGAAKVVSEHSMTWTNDAPLGAGRPNQDDRGEILRLVDSVTALPAAGQWQPLGLAALDYQPREIKDVAPQRNVALLKNIMPPITLDADLCDECGLCADKCSNQNITLEPLPVFGDNCIFCLNCVRVCPNQALDNAALAVLGDDLRSRAEGFGEPAETRIFLPGPGE